ncbi:hypothetical protein SAMN05192560_1935 [Methylobacillus rhizosphaerae]|uniref:Uncharacterized protein n=1 Tax=Methylobacillus rhizosphaerae TaxID=551994 RepID=A0A239AHF2_9PROT|nr:hypothetical protein SAMN05192560_1935 [Methylobacillus rhizosphaerae]
MLTRLDLVLFRNDDLGLFRLSIDYELFADMMYRDGVGFFADFLQHCDTGSTVIAEHLDLDQLVGFQADIDFLQNLFRQAVIADHHYRMQIVGETT